MVLDVDRGHARVDVVANNRDPLAHASDDDAHGVQRQSLPSWPTGANTMKVAMGVHVGQDQTKNSNLVSVEDCQ